MCVILWAEERFLRDHLDWVYWKRSRYRKEDVALLEQIEILQGNVKRYRNHRLYDKLRKCRVIFLLKWLMCAASNYVLSNAGISTAKLRARGRQRTCWSTHLTRSESQPITSLSSGAPSSRFEQSLRYTAQSTETAATSRDHAPARGKTASRPDQAKLKSFPFAPPYPWRSGLSYFPKARSSPSGQCGYQHAWRKPNTSSQMILLTSSACG